MTFTSNSNRFARRLGGLLLGMTLSLSAVAQTEQGAASQAALPSPLTLEAVLSVPPSQLPQLEVQSAQVEKSEAGIALNASEEAVQVDLLGRLAWREYADDSEDFHMAALRARKSLYDFGKRSYQTEAARAQNKAEKRFLQARVEQARLAVMKGFFDVLLADFQYRIDNEAMAVAYIAFDKARDRHELQRISDVDFLQMESDYEQILVKRQRSEYNQLKTRLALANLIGRPDFRPDELAFPGLKDYASRDAEKLELEALQQQAVADNPEMTALKQQLHAAQQLLQSREADGKPDISVQGKVGKLSSHPQIREGRWQIGLHLEMPLYDGGRTEARVSQARAELKAIQGRIRQLEQTLRDQVAEVYFQLKMLAAEKKRNFIFADYADLYLDYSRALYENESATDLGDAMVRLSQANYDQVEWKFKQALLWAKLDYLTGKGMAAFQPVQMKAGSQTTESAAANQGTQS